MLQRQSARSVRHDDDVARRGRISAGEIHIAANGYYASRRTRSQLSLDVFDNDRVLARTLKTRIARYTVYYLQFLIRVFNFSKK